MKTRPASLSVSSVLLASAVFLGILRALPARGDWLALDGQNTVWRLADTNGSVTSQFASLSPYHQAWNAIAPGPNGNVCLSMASDVANNQAQILGPDGALQQSIVVGPRSNGMLVNPASLAFGPDGNLCIVGAVGPGSPEIARYNGTSGAFMGILVTNTSPNNLAFGRDGNLYVADAARGVLRYDGPTGAFIDTFVPLGSNGVPDAAGLAFGPDANLYVCSGTSNAVIRFNGTNGQFIDDFVASGSGGLASPRFLTFGPDGNLYVSGSFGSIFRYDGQTGRFLDIFGAHAVLGLVYLPATPPAPVPLSLQIQAAGSDRVQISWNAGSDSGWTVYRLTGPGLGAGSGASNAWVAMTNPPSAAAGTYIVMDSCTGIAAFYRLLHR